jgi:hypothetical protein
MRYLCVVIALPEVFPRYALASRNLDIRAKLQCKKMTYAPTEVLQVNNLVYPCDLWLLLIQLI